MQNNHHDMMHAWVKSNRVQIEILKREVLLLEEQTRTILQLIGSAARGVDGPLVSEAKALMTRSLG